MKLYKFIWVALCAGAITFTACTKKAGQMALSDSNGITAFTVDTGQVGNAVITTTADSDKVLVYVQNGIDLTNVTPRIVIPAGATIKPASGVKANFTNTQVYTVTSQSGTTQKWYVQVKVFPKPDLSKYIANAKPDSQFNAYFTRYSGWNSGDGAKSVQLPGGRVAWFFGDSFVGAVNPDRSLVPNKYALVNNAMMVQNGGTFVTFAGGTIDKPKSLFIPADPTHFYWTMDGIYDNGKLYVFLMELGRAADNSLVHLVNRMAVINITTYKMEKLITIPYYNEVSFGSMCFDSGNYHYIWGDGRDGWNTTLYIARTPKGKVEQMWEFYTANGWVKAPTKAIPINITGHVTAPSVVNRNGRYYLFTQRNFYSKDILMLRADKPEGPYTDEVTLYTTPDVSQTYLAIAHPEFIQNNTILIGYSLGGDIFQMVKNIDIGRPMFIRVNLPE